MFDYGKSLIAINAFRDAKDILKKAKLMAYSTNKL